MMIIIIADAGEVATLLDLSDKRREPEIIRPQTSGPCVHCEDGVPCTCAYPYGDGTCPHLDNPDIICPVKDACYAMRDVARMRDACEAEQAAQDDDMVARELVYETAAPEWVEPAPDDGAPHTYTVPATRKPTNPNAWSDEEIEVIRRAQSAAEAGRLYSETYGIWKRSRSAVTTRWYKLRAAGELIEPEPEEPDFIVPHPTFRPGDRVRIKHALHRGQTGKIERYFPATENYLVAIDGVPDMIILQDSDLEAV
ncbi:MAG TPA: hypothetical protein VJY40_07865 [Corynebacterium sp.]|nr:hypothetical protein [Corynebacterium sp.]